MTRFQTSWEIAKRSWAVLRSDKSLAWFPVFSALGSLLVIGVLGGLFAVAGIDNSSTGTTTLQGTACKEVQSIVSQVDISYTCPQSAQ